MADVLYVAILVAFFGLAAALVAGCDKIIGEFEIAKTQPAEEDDPGLSAPDAGVPA